jgi:hypothetical protein
MKLPNVFGTNDSFAQHFCENKICFMWKYNFLPCCINACQKNYENLLCEFRMAYAPSTDRHDNLGNR